MTTALQVNSEAPNQLVFFYDGEFLQQFSATVEKRQNILRSLLFNLFKDTSLR